MNFINNNIDFKDIENFEIQKSEFNFNLDDEVNNISKTHIFPKRKKNNNINDINNNIKINISNTNEEINNNKINIIQNNSITPQGPIFNEKNNKINLTKETPGGETQDNIINNNYQNSSEYSFDCTNAMYLNSYINKGTEEVNLELIVKNNGDKTWHENTKFKILDSSDIKTNDIILNPQKPEEEKSYFLTFKNLSKYPEGDYRVDLVFCSNGKICGDKLPIKIKIKDYSSQNNEIKENMDKIKEFRETFNLSESEYSNEKILDTLKENDFNYENAFGSLFD